MLRKLTRDSIEITLISAEQRAMTDNGKQATASKSISTSDSFTLRYKIHISENIIV